MKKSIIIKGSFFVMAFALAWACSDSFLDKKPLGVYDQAALSNKAGVESSLISAYHMLSGYNIDNANTWAANPVNFVFGSIDTDDAYKGSEANDDPGGFKQTELYDWSAGMINLSDKWIPTYEGVRRANATLNLLAKAKDVSDDDKKRITGEAIFLRAWYHFELYKVFTHVPYFREGDTDLKKTNVGVDVLAECIADMKQIVDGKMLPDAQSDVGRVNMVAANAFYGKLLLYNKDYANAKTYLAKVVAVRSLNGCFKDIFTMGGENSSESIFSVQASINDNNQARNGDWLNQLAYPVGPAGAFGCCGFHQPSQNLVNAFKVDPGTGLPLNSNASDDIPDKTVTVDPRLDLTVGRDGVPYLDWGVHAASWIRSRTFSGPYSPKKYMQFQSDPSSGGGWNANATSAVNVQLIRLSDVMLMLAETDVETPDLPSALKLVNTIRARAANCFQGPNVDAASGAAITGKATIISDAAGAGAYATYKVGQYSTAIPDQNQVREIVRLERRLELALEGHRFFDLKRYSLNQPGFNPNGDGTTFYMKGVLDLYVSQEVKRRGFFSDAKAIQAKHMSFPIPSNQVQLGLEDGNATLVQNEGW